MERKSLKRVSQNLFIAACLLPFSFSVFAADPAGFVLMASGDVHAVQTDKKLRKLKRKSPFYPGETLKTGAKAKAQVRFQDGSLISLRPLTELRIDEFRFDSHDKGEDKNIFTLVSGGFRTITGKIGKKKPENYKMKSGVASIGVRGTQYSVHLGDALDVAVWDGSIVVENEKGILTLGELGAFNFANVGSARKAPKGLERAPRVFQENTHQFEVKDEPEEPVVDEGEQPAPTGEGEPGQEEPVGDGPGTPPEPEPTPPPLPPLDPPLPAPQPEPPEEVTKRAVVVPTLDRLGMALQAGPGFQGMIAGGRASGPGTEGPVITDNGLGPSDTGFDTTGPVTALFQQNAPLFSDGIQTFNVSTGYDVSWGVWQASATSPAWLATDMTDDEFGTNITQPIFWSTFLATPDTTMSAKTGSAQFRNVVGFMGGGSGGQVSDVYVGLDVDFDSGFVDGGVNIYTASDVWALDVNGVLAGPTLEITSMTGTVNGSGSVSGELFPVLTGDQAQAIVTGFDLEHGSDPSTHVEGLFLVDNTPVADVWLTTSEAASLDRVGVFAKSNAFAGTGMHVGGATDGSLGSPIFVENGLLPGDAGFTTAPLTAVYRQGTANSQVVVGGQYSHGVYPVSWGIWDGTAAQPALAQLSAFDPLQTFDIDEPILWMTVQPTNDVVLGGIGGRGYYHSSGDYGGLSNTGALYWLEADVVVDFDSATFEGSVMLDTNVGSDRWDVFLSGSVVGPRLEATNLNGFYNGVSGANETVTGEASLMLTGSTQPDAIAGMVDLELASDSAVFVQATFLSERDQRLTYAEASSFDRLAVGVVAGSGFNNTFIAQSSDGAGGSPLMGLNSAPLDDPTFKFGTFSSVYRQGSAPTLVTTTSDTSYQTGTPDPVFEVSWGAWDGLATGFTEQTDPANGAVQNLINEPLYWMTLVPSDETIIAARTGSVTYANPITTMIGGIGTAGNIDASSFNFSADVDFDAGALANGNLNFSTTGADTWSANFTGTLNGPGLDLTTSAVLHNGSTPGSGTMTGVITGPNAEAIGGSLDFESAGGGVEGVYLVNCVGDPSC